MKRERRIEVQAALCLVLALLLGGCGGWQHGVGITTNEGPRPGNTVQR